MTLEDRLLNLSFQDSGIAGGWMQRRKQSRSAREIALGLSNARFVHQCVRIIRNDVQDLIELARGLGEASETDIGEGVLGKKVAFRGSSLSTSMK